MMTFLAWLSVLLPLIVAPQESSVPVDDVTLVLARAARFQRGEAPLPRPNGLHGRFYVTVRKPDGGSVNADVERIYTRSPERMVTTRVDSIVNTNSTVGYDGSQAWFRDNVSGKVIDYSADPEAFDVDLEELQWQLHLTRLILDAAVVDSLLPRLELARIRGRGEFVDPAGDVHAVHLVRAQVVDDLFPPDPDVPPPLPDDPPPMLRVDMSIDVETGAMWSVRVETLDRAVPRALTLHFAYHTPTRHGLTVPANIKVYEGVAKDWSVNLGLAVDETAAAGDADYVVFDLDPPVDAAQFAMPETEG